MDYTTLVAAKTTAGSIANWVNRGDLPVTDILAEAEAWIYQRLRVREMQQIATLTFAEDASSAALPDGFLDPIQYEPRQWGGPLEYVHEAALLAPTDDDGNPYEGTPSRWTVMGETAYVDVTCVEAFSGRLLYYKQPDALSGSNLTNFLTRRYPALVRKACMGKAFEHGKDTARTTQYLAMAEAEIKEAARTNDLARRGQTYPAY
jgi:hypothetical protein